MGRSKRNRKGKKRKRGLTYAKLKKAYDLMKGPNHSINFSASRPAYRIMHSGLFRVGLSPVVIIDPRQV